uniref:Uncharacterized protein n=1 Tax=Arundo donax TaxID=35708 RepID=A0A0A8YVZ7_ARUDO
MSLTRSLRNPGG